jgi:hypothetical protein
MKYLLISVVFFIYYFMISGQDIAFPTDEDISHVSGGNSTVIQYDKNKYY